MYLIVTEDAELLRLAQERGASIFESNQNIFAPIPAEVVSERQIAEVLGNLAILPNYSGYRYIEYILKKCIADPNYHREKMTEVIYPECAAAFGTTNGGIERGIRHAIERGFAKVPENYNKYFKLELQKAPINSRFISTLSEFFRISCR